MPDTISSGVADRLWKLSLPAIVISTDYRVLAVNVAYRERYGDSIRLGEDRCHWVSHRYTTPCDKNGERCPLSRCRHSGAPERVTHIHHTPRGPEHCDILLEPIRDGAGVVIQYLEIIEPIETASAQPGGATLLGCSRPFQRLVELVARVAPSEAPVLLMGETGTGKELLAQAIHQGSARRDGPFVPLECSGLNPALFEAALFGHEKGSFTGASRQRDGLVALARGGTLFLDEIGDVSLELQVKLLRLLEQRAFRSVGSDQLQVADFRLVCATHRALPSMVASGQFRRDLYYRISTFPIVVPPLRERTADVALLARAFLQQLAPEKRLTAASIELLEGRSFPGNVRELKHLIFRATLLCDGADILPEHLDDVVSLPVPDAAAWPWGEAVLPLAEVEERYLRWVASRSTDRAELAEQLGISERSLYRKLRKLKS